MRSTALGARKSDWTAARLLARSFTAGREEFMPGGVVFALRGGFWGAAAARVDTKARRRVEACMMKRVAWKD